MGNFIPNKIINYKHTYMKQNLQQQLAIANKAVEAAQKKAKTIQDKINKQAERSKPKPVFEEFNTMALICKKLKQDPKKDIVKVHGFDQGDHDFITNIISRMRCVKVANKGVLPKRGDKRWYPFSYLNSSGPGLVFRTSIYGGDLADASSAARLAFLSEQDSTNYFKTFKKIEEGIIQL